MTLTESLTTMFDLDAFPSIIPNDDSARTRKGDPITSHVAGDNSQRNLHESKRRVLELVELHAPITGRELNDLYSLAASRLNWKRIHFDSPRRRAGELAKDGYLEVVGTQIAEGNNSPEAAYGLTDLGREAIA